MQDASRNIDSTNRMDLLPDISLPFDPSRGFEGAEAG